MGFITRNAAAAAVQHVVHHPQPGSRFLANGHAVGAREGLIDDRILDQLVHEWVVGCSEIGTVVFHDLRSEQEIEELNLSPAALLLTRVISHPAAGIVTCDAGSKSIAADAGDPCAFVIGHPGLVAMSPSEEHLPLAVTAGRRPDRGELLWLVPRHVCPTVNLADMAVMLEGESIVSTTRITARGHELIP